VAYEAVLAMMVVGLATVGKTLH